MFIKKTFSEKDADRRDDMRGGTGGYEFGKDEGPLSLEEWDA